MYQAPVKNPHPAVTVSDVWLYRGREISRTTGLYQPPPCGGLPVTWHYRCYSCGQVWLVHSQCLPSGETIHYSDDLYCHRCSDRVRPPAHPQRSVVLSRPGIEPPDKILILDFLNLTGGIPSDYT